MNTIENLRGLELPNGLNFNNAISDFNGVTWLSGVQLKQLKNVPEYLANVPNDIKNGLKQVTTDFCNLFTKEKNLEESAKILQNATSLEKMTDSVNDGMQGLVNGNVTDVLLRSNCWTVGGIVFDGVLQCEHSSESKPTDYLVQTGVVMSDHMINQPVTLSMSIIMSDITPEQLQPVNKANAMTLIQEVNEQLESSKNISNYVNFKGAKRRSEFMFKLLKGIQLANYPLEITTRLYNYNNMVITGLSAVENAESFNGLVCNIQFREIMMAETSKRVIAKRILDDTTQKTGGQYTASDVTNGKTILGYNGITKDNLTVRKINSLGSQN